MAPYTWTYARFRVPAILYERMEVPSHSNVPRGFEQSLRQSLGAAAHESGNAQGLGHVVDAWRHRVGKPEDQNAMHQKNKKRKAGSRNQVEAKTLPQP